MIMFNCSNISSLNEGFLKFNKSLGSILKRQISNIIKYEIRKNIKIAILEESWEVDDLLYKKSILLFDLEVIKLNDDKFVSIAINRNNEVINYYIPFKLLSHNIIAEIDAIIRPLSVEEYFSQRV